MTRIKGITCQEQGLVLKNVGLVVVEPGKRATDVEEGFARSEFEPPGTASPTYNQNSVGGWSWTYLMC
jgi:hypothetical protein